MERELVTWLGRYGAPMLFVAQVFGIFGLPIPDELLLTVAGALVRKGLLHGSSIATAAVAGCLSGITLSYAMGRLVDAAFEGSAEALVLALLEGRGVSAAEARRIRQLIDNAQNRRKKP